MNVDMEMDVAWCLTCSKQTRDPRSPYCSDACRLQDTDPAINQDNPVLLTSPVPFGLMLSPKQSAQKPGHTPTSRAKDSPLRRPSIGPLAPLPSSSRSKPVPRDRRAFSFPAAHSTAPIDIKLKPGNARRGTQTVETLQFARKANPVAVSSMAASPGLGVSQGRLKQGFDKLSKTTGANTPVIQDSVFCSTSESSDNEALDMKDVSPMKIPQRLMPLETTVKASSRKPRGSITNAFTAPSQSSHIPTPIHTARPAFVSRKSPSPVAAMVASSASSKSREDIVSWINDVKRPPIKEHGHEDEQEHENEHLDATYRPRGRSRTRREVLANLPPPSQEPLDDDEGENGLYGTTPKGRIGSALAGLSTFGGFGVGPIVKALTGGTSSSNARPITTAPTAPAPAVAQPATTGLGLQSVPAPAEVSRIAVTVGATPSEPETSNLLQTGGATPTLSTISFSEVVDPFTDNGEHVDFMTMTDDQSAAGSSSFIRRAVPSGPRRASATLAATASKKQSPKGSSLPLKPITSTASAIWNLSTYLRSFAPFSVSSVIPPYVPFAAVDAQAKPADSTTATAAPSPVQTPEQAAPITAPVPASRPEPPQDEESAESPAQQMVRSLPMNIILPIGGENPQLERLRRHEMREWLDTPNSRSASRSRVRSRSGSRARSTSRARRPSRSASHSHSRHGRKVSYDADASEEEEGVRDERRGRSRREKVLRKSSEERRTSEAEVEVDEDEEQEQERGRGRGRGRGRERTTMA